MKGKDLGFAYRQYMDLVPENDWALLLDHDMFFTTEHWFRSCENAIERKPNAGAFCAMTFPKKEISEYPEEKQWRYHDEPCIYDVRTIIQKGKALYHKKKFKLKEIPSCRGIVMGFFMLIKKSVWMEIEDKIRYGYRRVDSSISVELNARNLKVYLLQDLLVYHFGPK